MRLSLLFSIAILLSSVLIIIFLSAPAAAVSTCYNPSSTIYCQQLNLSSSALAELCCAGNATCERQLIGPYRTSLCEAGCCYNEKEGSCTPYATRFTCAGLFNTTAAGACELGGKALYPACSTSCCCTGNGFMELSSDACSARGGLTINNTLSPEHCATLCQDACAAGYCNRQPATNCSCAPGERCVLGSICVSASAPKPYRCGTAKVASCSSCQGRPLEKGGQCVNASGFCGNHSSYVNGVCACDTGFFDDTCHSDQMIDLESDGCIPKNPCSGSRTSSSATPYFIGAIAFVLVIILYLLYVRLRKGRPPKAQAASSSSWPSSPGATLPTYPTYPPRPPVWRPDHKAFIPLSSLKTPRAVI